METLGPGPSYQDFKSKTMNKECIVEAQVPFFLKTQFQKQKYINSIGYSY
jgi:hypothetical protein